jgi:hypothetical protein
MHATALKSAWLSVIHPRSANGVLTTLLKPNVRLLKSAIINGV